MVSSIPALGMKPPGETLGQSLPLNAEKRQWQTQKSLPSELPWKFSSFEPIIPIQPSLYLKIVTLVKFKSPFAF